MRIVYILKDGKTDIAVTDKTLSDYSAIVRERGEKKIVYRETPIIFQPSPYPPGTETVQQILNAIAGFNQSGETDIAVRFIECIALVAYVAGRTCDHCERVLHCPSCWLT